MTLVSAVCYEFRYLSAENSYVICIYDWLMAFAACHKNEFIEVKDNFPSSVVSESVLREEEVFRLALVRVLAGVGN